MDVLRSVPEFELRRRDVAESLVTAAGIELGDPVEDRQLELGSGAPDAVGDQLGLEVATKLSATVELATAIHDYIELFHNTRRSHSVLGMLSPTDYEANYFLKTNPAA